MQQAPAAPDDEDPEHSELGDLSRLLRRASEGDEAAEREAMRLTYLELRRMAASFRRKERSDLTLQASDIVQEVYLRIIRGDQQFQNSSHFFGTAATVMRHVLVDHARRHLAERRGGGAVKVTLDKFLLSTQSEAERVICIDEALSGLEAIHPRPAQVVQLHFFCGLGWEEIAQIVGLSSKTVKRDWSLAKAWLRREIGPAAAFPA